MIIGHLPAGYITSRLLSRHLASMGAASEHYLWAGILGAIAPDFDMAYFFLFDHRQHHHHAYWSHFPLLWVSISFLAVFWLAQARRKSHAALAAIFSLNGLVHTLLDSVVGDIRILAPFSDRSFSLFTDPSPGMSTAIELAILVWAIALGCHGLRPQHKILTHS